MGGAASDYFSGLLGGGGGSCRVFGVAGNFSVVCNCGGAEIIGLLVVLRAHVSVWLPRAREPRAAGKACK